MQGEQLGVPEIVRVIGNGQIQKRENGWIDQRVVYQQKRRKAGHPMRTARVREAIHGKVPWMRGGPPDHANAGSKSRLLFQGQGFFMRGSAFEDLLQGFERLLGIVFSDVLFGFQEQQGDFPIGFLGLFQ